MNKVQNAMLIMTVPIVAYLYNENANLQKKTQTNSHKIQLKNDVSGTTILSVSKTVAKTWDNDTINVYENEKKWINRLKETNIIAKPVHFDDVNRTITTEYVGEKINKHNIPANWEKQRDSILSVLEKHNCRHNDIKPDEIIVHNGEIKLIDFGWANELNQSNPDNWPEGLGCKFRCNEEGAKFNDKCSFDKSVYFIQDDKLK